MAKQDTTINHLTIIHFTYTTQIWNSKASSSLFQGNIKYDCYTNKQVINDSKVAETKPRKLARLSKIIMVDSLRNPTHL
jgi:hypothetical protein